MADIRDEHGNPIQLADQYGKPVQLTDEYGNPIHIKGVATTHAAGDTVQERRDEADQTTHYEKPVQQTHYEKPVQQTHYEKPVQQTHEPMHTKLAGETATTHTAVPVAALVPEPLPVREPHQLQEQLRRSGSSSSSSSEDDGQGGRKKKGLKEKIKATFGGGKNKDKDEVGAAPATTVTHVTEHHEKKGIMEKIKEKLPGHHHNP